MNKKHLFVSAAMSALIGIGSIVSGFSSGTPVLAAGNASVRGPVIYAQKYLVMDEEASVPDVTFTYTIAPGEKVNYNKEKGTAAITPGPDKATIGSATFEKGQDTFTSPHTMEKDSGATDTVSLAKGQKYARKNIEIDLSKVEFTEPGIYRYRITENSSSEMKAIKFDEESVRCLDVYIQYDDNENLSVAGSILHKSASELPKEGSTPAEKDNGFENEYVTHNLTISKKVKGNQASHDRYFVFTVNIESAEAGSTYEVDVTKADAEVAQDGETYTNPSQLTIGEDKKGSATFMLRNDQSVCIQGLANTTKYTVSEDNQDYEATITVNKESLNANTTGMREITADTTAAFLNTKEGDIPTGLFENGAVWAILLGAGIAGLVAASRRKKG